MTAIQVTEKKLFAVIDCGTTNTRIYVVNEKRNIIASGERMVGIRDTSITGSNEKLKAELKALFETIIADNGLKQEDILFAVASGMITSELGLIEIPHMTAPCGLNEIAGGIVRKAPGELIDIPCPIYFVRGIRNDYGDAKVKNMRHMDFMRGEEVQCMGILEKYGLSTPCNIVVLSSHTKNIFINSHKQIAASCTTMSGQLYNALIDSTFLGASLKDKEEEQPGGYSWKELVDQAEECTNHSGFSRSLLNARFMQVLLKTDSVERNIFVDAVIASDDMKSFGEMKDQGFDSQMYILVGHEPRCRMYEYMLKKKFGEQIKVISISDKAGISELTVLGSAAVAFSFMKGEEENV